MPASEYERLMKPNEKLMVEYLFYLRRLKYVRMGHEKENVLCRYITHRKADLEFLALFLCD